MANDVIEINEEWGEVILGLSNEQAGMLAKALLTDGENIENHVVRAIYTAIDKENQ